MWLFSSFFFYSTRKTLSPQQHAFAFRILYEIFLRVENPCFFLGYFCLMKDSVFKQLSDIFNDRFMKKEKSFHCRRRNWALVTTNYIHITTMNYRLQTQHKFLHTNSIQSISISSHHHYHHHTTSRKNINVRNLWKIL